MKVLSFFLGYWRSSDSVRARYAWGMFALMVTASIITGATNTALLSIINNALNAEGIFSPTLILAYIGLCLLMPATKFASEAMLNLFLVEVILNLHLGFCRRILSTPLQKLEGIGAARLTAILGEDIRTIAQAFLSFILVCMHLTIVLTGVAYLAWLSVDLLLAIFGFVAVTLVIYQLMVRRGQAYLAMARQAYDGLFHHFQALTEGNKELKLNRNRRKAFLDHQFQPTAQAFRRNILLGNTIYDIAKGVGQALYFVLIGIVVFGLSSWQNVSTEVLTGYSLVLLFMMGPFEAVVTGMIMLDRASVSVKKLEEVGLSLATARDDQALMAAVAAKPMWERLELKGIQHTYIHDRRTHRFTLGPMDLSFHPGEIVFIVGGNGSGKTTLAKLLVGLYTPEVGEIYLDGQKITDENRDDYRQHFSVVFSDFYLFDQLLGFGSSPNAAALDEQARGYLQTLALDEKVEIQDGRLSTTDLSQGQRKRLALLSAYLEDRPFYVFDEWAANQDPVFRTIFYTQLLPELKQRGKTVVAVTHDDKFFHVADRIIKLEYGQLELDTHKTAEKHDGTSASRPSDTSRSRGFHKEPDPAPI